MIAATDDFIASNSKDLENLMKGIQKSCEIFKKNKKSSLDSISKKCKLDEEDSNFWFNEVQFSLDSKISKKVLNFTMDTLVECGVIKEKVDVENLIKKDLTPLKE